MQLTTTLFAYHNIQPELFSMPLVSNHDFKRKENISITLTSVDSNDD